MKITLTPTRDSHNSEPSENVSGVVLTSDTDEQNTTRHLFVTLPDGREMAFRALDVAKALRALGVA